MTLPVLICDDSGFARKQLARSLPADWDIDLHYAANGQEAIALIEQGKGDLLFLDLNMPVMDGYEVLEAVRSRDLPTMIIVVSGDVQEQARQRVKELGALDFITKPVDRDELELLLRQFGLLQELTGGHHDQPRAEETVDLREGYREVANIAMGQAAALLAKVLDAFIDLPIPNVYLGPRDKFSTRPAELMLDRPASVVSQGFVGSGVSGEALLLFADQQFDDLARLLGDETSGNREQLTEHLLEVSNLLIGACLRGFCHQLDMVFSTAHPVILARGENLSETALIESSSDQPMMAIEIIYQIKAHQMTLDLLLLFDTASIQVLEERVGLLLEG